MTYNRLNQLVLLATNTDGEVWLTTPAELQDEFRNRDGGRFPSWPQTNLTVYEVAGGAVTGPLKVEYVPSFRDGENEQVVLQQVVLHYPDGRTAFRIDRPARTSTDG